MASLIVSLHELTESYMKRAKNKDVAAKICSEILLRSKEVVKKYLWEGEDVCMFYVAPMYPILSKELLQWNTIIKRRMKAITSLVRPRKIMFTRNVHCSRGVRFAKAYNFKRKLWQGCKKHTLC